MGFYKLSKFSSVNLDEILWVHRVGGGGCEVVLRNGAGTIPISYESAAELVEFLERL